MSKYQDPVIAKYIDLLKSKCGSIRAYYEGEPVRVPVSDIPCVLISKRTTQVGPHTNAEDEHAIGMAITLITDIRKDLSTDDDMAKVAAGVSSLYEIMEGRNADYSLKDTSILGVLRHNQNVDLTNNLRTDLSTVTRVDYSQTLQDRPSGQVQVECRLDFVAYFTHVR